MILVPTVVLPNRHFAFFQSSGEAGSPRLWHTDLVSSEIFLADLKVTFHALLWAFLCSYGQQVIFGAPSSSY